jgi:hypothetical protein
MLDCDWSSDVCSSDLDLCTAWHHVSAARRTHVRAALTTLADEIRALREALR